MELAIFEILYVFYFINLVIFHNPVQEWRSITSALSKIRILSARKEFVSEDFGFKGYGFG